MSVPAQAAIRSFYAVSQGDISAVYCTGNCVAPSVRIKSLDAPWGAAFTLTVLYSPH